MNTGPAWTEIILWLIVVARWSRTSGWSGEHLVAALIGNLVSIGGPAFITTPLGHIPTWEELTSNIVLLALVLSIAAVAYTVERNQSSTW